MYYWEQCIWPPNLLVWWWPGSDHLKYVGLEWRKQNTEVIIVLSCEKINWWVDFCQMTSGVNQRKSFYQLLILSKTWTSALVSIPVVNDSTTRRSHLKKVNLMGITASILTKQYFDNINEYSSLLIDSLTGDLIEWRTTRTETSRPVSED